MKHYLLGVLFFLTLSYNRAYSQDLIVTIEKDSIAGKIVDDSGDLVRYTYIRDHQIFQKQIGKDRVFSIQYGYYTNPANIKNVSVKKSNAGQLAKWQFGLNGGFAYRLFRAPIGATAYQTKYLDRLRKGFSVGGDVFYFPWKKIGVGLKYDLFSANHSRDIRTKDDVRIHFLGSSIAYRSKLGDSGFTLLPAFWLGYQHYKNSGMFLGQQQTLSGNTMVWGASVGLERAVSKHLAISLAGTCYLGSAYKLNRNFRGVDQTIELGKDNFEDLTRAQITLGFKILN